MWKLLDHYIDIISEEGLLRWLSVDLVMI
jgi:hypothetical protein